MTVYVKQLPNGCWMLFWRDGSGDLGFGSWSLLDLIQMYGR